MDFIFIILVNFYIGLVASESNQGCQVHGLRRSFWCLSIADSFQNEGEFAFVDLKAIYDIRKFIVGDVKTSYNKYSDEHITLQTSIDGLEWNTVFWHRQNSSFLAGNQTLMFNRPSTMRYVRILLEPGLNTGHYKCITFQPFGCKSSNQDQGSSKDTYKEQKSIPATESHRWIYIIIAFTLFLVIVFQLGLFIYLKQSFRKKLNGLTRELALLASGQLNDLKQSDGVPVESHDRVILLHHQDI